MADRETQIVNFYESTLATLLASAATSTTLTTAPTTNGTTAINASGSSYYYLVIDPDNSATREVVLVTASSGTTISAMTRDLEGRHTSDPDHQAGTTVRMAVLAEHFEDMNDRLDTGLASLATALQTSDLQDDDTFASAATDKVASSESIKAYVDASGFTLLDEDDMASNSATAVASQQSIKAYADTKATIGLIIALGG